MKTLILFLILPFTIWSCQNKHTKDLTPILKVYQESIRKIDEREFNKVIFYMNKCDYDSIVHNYKQAIQILHLIEQHYPQSINGINDYKEIKSLYKTYGDSLINSTSLKSLIEKDTKLIYIEKMDDYTISELKIITEINLILLEKKIREDLFGSIAIDCPDFN